MQNIIAFLSTRRSVKPRDMTQAGPSAAERDLILTLGARVPDHGKIAPWRFIVLEGDGRARAGALVADTFAKRNPDASADDKARAGQAFADAPLVIAVVSRTVAHPKVPAWEQELSAGASCMAIVTAASAMGYAANWLTGWFAFDREVLTGLGLTETEKLAGFIHIGGLKDKPEDRPRPALPDLLTVF